MHRNSIILTKEQARFQCKIIMSIAKANTQCSNLYTLVDFAQEVKSLWLLQHRLYYDVVDFSYSVLSRFDVNFQVLTSAK